MTAFALQAECRTDRYEQLVSELREEWNCHEVAGLADKIVAAEALDFHWAARTRERYLGQQWSGDLGWGTGDDEQSRIAILSWLAGRWHVGSCVVDGDGQAQDLLWLRTFDSLEQAESAFSRAH